MSRRTPSYQTWQKDHKNSHSRTPFVNRNGYGRKDDMMQMRARSLSALALRFLSEPPAVDLQVCAFEEEAEVGG